MKKLAAISLVLAMTAASLAGCGSTANTAAPAESEAAETPAATTEETTDTAADTVAADGKVYNIGICQLVQHEALDAATQGFQDALTKLLGEENVKFDLQNASGDSATCATIVNQFVSSDVDLILANATALCRQQRQLPMRFRFWEPALQTMRQHFPSMTGQA